MSPPTADVGKWVRIQDRTEHLIVQVVRRSGPDGRTLRITGCGKQLLGDWDAVMIGPTRQACPACKAHAESESSLPR